MAAGVMSPRATARKRHDAGLARLPIVTIGLVVLLGLIAMLYISQSSAVATLGYDVKRLEAERARWIARNEQLRVEIGQLESLPRLEAAAARLGMVPPERVVFVQAPASAIVKRTDIDAEEAARQRAPLPSSQPDLFGQASLRLRQLWNGLLATLNNP